MPDRLPLTFLLGATGFLSLLLFAPLHRASVFHGGDACIYLLNAVRMLQGQAIYKDFFQFTAPGTELVYLGLFRVFGARAWIPNAMLLLLGVSLTWLSVAISRKVMRGWAAFLPGVLFLTCSFYSALDGTHHWYSVLSVMAAVAVGIEKRTPARLLAMGVLCGLALFFTQGRGLVAVSGFAVYLVWECRGQPGKARALLRNETCLVGGFLATGVATNGYFVWRAGLARFLDCTVVFGIRYYTAYSLANTPRVYLFDPQPPLRPWYGLPFLVVYLFIHMVVPLAYLLFLVRFWREARVHPEHPWDRLMLLSIIGLFLFAGVAPAPSLFRLCTVSLPAMILFVWFLTQSGRLEVALLKIVWAFAILMAVLEPVRVQRHARTYIDLPSGRTAFLRPFLYEQYRWISEHTQPSEFFFEGVWADTYVLLGLRNPTPVPYLTNTEYTRPEQVRDVVQALEREGVRLILWSFWLEAPQGEIAGDHLGPLRAYMYAHYHVVKTFAGGDQVWERK